LNGLSESGALWSCPSCKRKPAGRKSIIIAPRRSINTSISDLNTSSTCSVSNTHPIDTKLLTSEVSNIKLSIENFKETVQFFSDKFDEFNVQLKDFETLLSRVEVLENQNMKLQEDVSSLTARVHYLEQSSCSKDLILCGIPELENDSLTTVDLVADFIAATNIDDYGKNDIKSAKRIIPKNSSTNSQKKPNKILVKFHSTKARHHIKSEIRLLKRNSRTIKFHSQDVDFYAADYLTPYFNQLLYNVRDFARQNSFWRVWVSDANIMLRKQKTSFPITIKCLADLHKLSL
jgi:hypothetical protein